MKIYLMSSSTKLTFWLNQMTRFCWIGRRIALLNLAPSNPHLKSIPASQVTLKMKWLFLLAFTLLTVSVLSAPANDEEDGKFSFIHKLISSMQENSFLRFSQVSALQPSLLTSFFLTTVTNNRCTRKT